MKKRDKTRRAKTGKRIAITGLDRPFFLGGYSKLAGFMHYKPPRWTDEYAKMDDRDLFRRIRDDLEELLARAYPTYSDEWRQEFTPNYWRDFPITYAGRLRTVIHESVAESLCPGLMKRIRSPSEYANCRLRE